MREESDGLDCLDLLQETPSILRGLMRELNHEDAEWKPAPGRFSVAEVLAHLGHIRQIAELVRARKHRQQAGPLGEDYKLKP